MGLVTDDLTSLLTEPREETQENPFGAGISSATRTTMQSGWHLYSQVQPEDAIAIPTGFKLNSNPLLSLEGNIKEIGKMEKFHDARLEVSANQYANKVDFVQVVKLKANAKTNLTGSVEYQTCDDKKCLPPKTVNFTIPVK